jgi:hypothetical protein
MRWFKRLKFWVQAVLVIVLLLAVIGGSYWFVNKLFFSGADAAKARGESIVMEETGQAARETGKEATAEVIRRYETHTRIENKVTQGRAQVDQGWNGETVGEEVDRAGRAALCSLNDGFCGGAPPARVHDSERGTAPAAEVQRVCAGGAEEADPTRTRAC